MDKFIIKWFLNILVLFLVIKISPGITVDHWDTLAVAALTLGLVNAFLRPLILALTLPLNIFSLGIFTFFINGFMFYLAAKLVKGFNVVDFWAAFWGALWFSVISSVADAFTRPKAGKTFCFHKTTYSASPGPERNEYDNVIDVEKIEDNEKKDR
jgi:putative membrane protein